MGLLNHCYRSSPRSPLLLLCLLHALRVGRALPFADPVQRTPFRFHPHVGVPRELGAGDVAAMLMITSSPTHRRLTGSAANGRSPLRFVWLF